MRHHRSRRLDGSEVDPWDEPAIISKREALSQSGTITDPQCAAASCGRPATEESVWTRIEDGRKLCAKCSTVFDTTMEELRSARERAAASVSEILEETGSTTDRDPSPWGPIERGNVRHTTIWLTIDKPMGDHSSSMVKVGEFRGIRIVRKPRDWIDAILFRVTGRGWDA